MLTKEEVLEKLYNSKEAFIKILVRLGILKYKSHTQSKLDPRNVWVSFNFNYANPLTYIYLLIASIIGIPMQMFDKGLKEICKQMKKELKNGIEIWL